ncbi:aflC / pksA / pksL1 / polyketide synthase [Aspergillus flavus AF70]|uniref:PksA n=3 Tax=Aspergillus flavus TaxID=5059 RepID=Q5VDA4_ASPFL|nr:PksA [Aspergillus flavus]KOC17636.1 aflC / pksA / pksL1 / polyketide synthase [Aspergillus flavus AF70]
MAQSRQLFLFGDQTADFVPKLRSLLSVQDSPILAAFLDQSHYVVRAQMLQSMNTVDHKLARTADLRQMVQKYVDGKLTPAFRTALVCLCQLGCFIREYEESGNMYPQPSDSYVLGFCMGSLAAVAVSCSRSLSELLPIAVQTVLIAFRLGLCALEMRDRVDGCSDDRGDPWSTIVWGLDPQQARDQIEVFCQTTNVPQTRRPWISCISKNAITLSGSPSTLRAFCAMPQMAQHRTALIPICLPAHNGALFTQADITTILDTTPTTPWEQLPGQIPYISHVTGNVVQTTNYRDLIEVALSETLLEQVRLDLVETGLPRLLQSRQVKSVTIVPFLTRMNETMSNILPVSFISTETRTDTGRAIPASGRPGAGKCKLAIVSMSGRFPESPTTESFWDLLYKGLDVCKEVPRRRWDINTHVDPSGKARNKGATKWGCWLDFSGEFDPRFFGISPKEAPQMDPAQRMALMSTYEAMERAGLVPDTTPSTQRDRIGVFHGVTSNDWMETNTAQNIDTYFITGGNRGFIPGRINFCFEFAGPSYTNDTACSSSLAAIHLACNSLWRGDCDTAVAGGTNMIYTPDGHTGLDKGFFLSRTGNCKPYDDKADGYCRAEGVGTVFIKRLEDALADNDPILGVILDAKTNHSAMSESMTRPHVGAQIDNMTAALNTTGLHPNDFSYIEMHGTGTQVGDAVEMESVLSVFAPSETARKADQPLFVGSAKANVGHGEGVSGVTSLIKVLMMMQHDTIPPHCGIKPGSKINRNFPDLGARNVHIAFEPKPWPRTHTPRRVLINNFSAAGGNTALIVEDAPERHWPTEKDPRSSHIVALSAHVGASMKTNLERLHQYLLKNPHTDLAQLSYTTTARRWHYLHRVSVTGASVEEVTRKLEMAIQNGDGVSRPKSKPKILFAFTGQGSQYATMGKQVYDAYPSFREDLEKFDRLAQSHGFPSFLHVCTSPKGDVEEMAPVVVQLAITCLQMALTNLMTYFGIRADVTVGHSLGEFAALYAAGVLSASDVVYLVGQRAELLQERCQRGTHAMLAVKATPEALSQWIRNHDCEVACINGPEDTVLSGTTKNVAEVQRAMTDNGIKCTLLKLPFAFHSAQVQPILDDFEALAQGATFAKPQLPILSPLLRTEIHEQGVVTPSYVAQHCRHTVDMAQALRSAREKGLIDDKSLVIELGPKPLISGMVKMTLGDKISTLPTLAPNKAIWPSLQKILTSVYTGGWDINWKNYHAPFASFQKVVDLPSYGWDLKDYYIPYQGDWCLHRHQQDCKCAAPGHEIKTADYQVPPESMPHRPSKLDPSKEAFPEIKTTTTLHRVVEERTKPLGATLVVETDISRKDVNGLARGHLVDGIPLCTPSFYADIAMQVGQYSMQRLRAGHPGAGAIDGLVDVSDMVVDKALVPHGKGPQLLRTTLTMEWPPKAAATTRSAKVKFATYFADGKLDTEHASCTVRFTSDAQLKSLRRSVSEYKTHIRQLHDGHAKGQFMRYNRKTGYKLMSSMARFNPDYMLLDYLVLNEAENEAASGVDFSLGSSEGTFAAHPAHVDAITQVAGFAMNANDNVDIEKQVYVNHGWDSFQIYQPLDNSKSYQVYTKMCQAKENDLVHGDVVVLDGEQIVAFFRGLTLRSVPRGALRVVLQTTVKKADRQLGFKTMPSPPPPTTTMPISPYKPANTQVSSQAIPAEATHSHTPPQPKHSPVPETAGSAPAAKGVGVSNEKLDAVMRVVSEESGIALEELTDDSNFADMGIDSLSSMVIGSRFREDLGLDLGPEFSLFIDCTTVRALKDFMLGSGDAGSGSNVEDPPPSATPAINPEIDWSSSASDSIFASEDHGHSSESGADTGSPPALDLKPYCRPSTSVVLQGLPMVARKTLFMLPDGGGSAFSYASLPRLKSDTAVVGLNCPYARDPENMNCTHGAMIESFCNEIRRRQPRGPYHLGGWSSGGAFAYVVAEALVNQGEEVHSLIIIDAPIPQAMEQLPRAFYEHCNSIGLFATQPGASPDGSTEPPSYLIPHFIAVVDVMLDYKLAPLHARRMPKVGIVWAADTVMDERDAPKMKGMHFMIQKRTEFGPDGWDTIMPGASFDIVRADGANHFTLMQKEHVSIISDLIDRVMD